MQKPTKRLLALLLAAVMVVGLLPVSALAARVAEDVAAEVPLGEEAVSASLAERPAVPSDADAPAQLAAADSLTISGYTRVTSLPEGGLDDGYYLFIAPYDGNYYMLYPGATGAAASANNSARLVVDANGAATGYQVGTGTSYDSATESNDFSAADNLVTLRGDSNSRGALYFATAVGPDNATYYLCKKDTEQGPGALYQTNCESAFTIHPLTGDNAGYFNLRHQVGIGSYLIFYTTNMNFNQNSGLTTQCLGNFMIFKRDTTTPPPPTAWLQVLINEAKALTQADYIPRTWETLQTALTAAESAVTSQDYQTVKNAISALTAAKNGLQATLAVPTPTVTYTYPEATADTFEDGVYVIIGQGTGRSVYLYNSGNSTGHWGATNVGSGNLGNVPSDVNLILWKITKVTDANTPAGAYAVTIQGVLNNNYLTSGGASSSSQRTLSGSSETFYITKTTGNTYEIKNKNDNSTGQYFSFLDNNHWGMSTTEATVTLYKQTSTNIWTAEELRPAGGTTTDQPFPDGPGTVPYFYRIPALVTIENGAHAGRVVAAADARWSVMDDAKNIDTIVSYSDDNGATWHYSYPNFFGDTELTASATKAALFIDPVMTQDKAGNLYMIVNAYADGVANAGHPYQGIEKGTGFAEINGVQRMTIYTSPENSQQDNDNYSYYIGDFAPIGGSETKYAPILDAYDNSDSGFYVDDHFYLYKKAGAAADPAADIIYCQQLNSSNAGNGVWVQQNVFFYNATLHVRNAQFLYLVKSTDGGETWSAPMILNDQVRTGEHNFYGPGPGAGICLEDGTIVLPCYQGVPGEYSGFLYSSDGGATWKRTAPLSIGSESTVVEIDDTTIRQFYRDGNATVRYIDQIKGDDGVWAPTNEVVDTGAVKRTGNQLAALRYSTQIDGKTLIFVSTSTSANGGNAWSRWHGMIHAFQLNADKTLTLLSTYEVNTAEDWYGYSSLAELENGSIGLLYEDGHTDNSKYDHCGIRFVSISPYAILLSGLVARADALTQADYTPETWSGLATPLATAKAVKDGTDSTTSAQTAYENLAAALKALRKLEVTISGTVTANSAPVEGAVVTLENDNYAPVGLTATTDENGEFTFDNNNDADVTLSTAVSYKLKVQAPGFTYKVTTVNAAAFNDQKLSSNAITLEAQPEATYTNDFNEGDISMLKGATGDAATATLTVVDHNGSKAVKISGLPGGDTPVHVLDKNAHKLRNGVVAMDITPLSSDSHRFGFALRADGAGKRVWVGHFESNSTAWNYQSYDGGYSPDIGSNGPLMMTQNATRHVEVEMEGTTLRLWVDGVKVGEQSNLNVRNVLGYIGVSSTRSSAQFIIDNIYVRRTDPKSAVTLTATGGTLTGKVIADGVESDLTSGDTVYEGDTVVITGTGDSGKCLGGITLSDTTIEVTKTAEEGGGYSFSFVMPDHAVTVTGNFKTAVTGAKIEGRGVVAKDLTATALAGETEIPADGATYKWYHRESNGTWAPCTAGEAQTKTVTSDDQNKKVKVRVEGTGDYAGWFEKETDAVMGPADVETTDVTITRNAITMWKNLTTDPDASDDTVMGNTVQLTATVDPDNATNKTIVWTTSNEAVATVDQNGLVTAVGNGTATVKAEVTSADGTKVSDTVAITVKTGITDITLTKDGSALPSVLTIYANDGDTNQSVTVNAAVNDGASAADLVWSCGHDGEDHIFHLGPTDSAAGEATGGSVAITAYNSHDLVGEETVTVSAPTATGNTATAATFKVKVVHKLDATGHSVGITSSTGAFKVGAVLSVDLTSLPMADAANKVTYQWNRNGTAIQDATDSTYTLGAADVGGTFTVTVTAKTDSYYDGALTSAATAAVEKKDGPAAPTLSPTKPEAGQEKGYITITNYNSAYTYQIKSGTGNWEDATVTSTGKIEELAPGAYSVKVKETPTQKESAAATVTINDADAVEYTITSTDPTEGATISVTDKAAKDTTVEISLTVTEGWQVTAVKVNDSSDGVTKGEGNTWTFTMPEGNVTVTAEVSKIKVTITHNLTNVKCGENHTGNEAHEVDYGTHTTVTLSPVDDSYELDPSSIKVTQTGNTTALGTDYVTREGGTLTFVNGVTQNITITASAEKKTFTASFNPETGGNLTRAFTSTTPIAYGDTLTATLTPASGYSAPAKENVQVTVGGAAAEFTYAVGENGVATITVEGVKGTVVIKAAGAVKNTTAITAASISGTPTEGNTLSITGVTPAGATYSVSWQKADAQDGTYAQIATADTYQLTASDVGKYFKAVVSGAEDYSGTVTTAAVGPVAAKVIPATGVTITVPQGSGNTVLFGETLSLTATVTPTNATAKTVKWSSDNTSVATVDENTGVVTPVKVGAATILATVINSDGSDGVTDSVSITVSPAPIALRLTGSAVETKTLTATVTPAGATVGEVVHLAWYRVGGDVATGGDLLLDNDDQTTYTLTSDDVGYRIKVTASVPSGSESNYTGSAVETTPAEVVAVGDEVFVESVTLNKSKASVAVDGTVTLTATVLPNNATNKTVFWVSDNEPVATVDQNGVVTGVTEGTAIISVFTDDGDFTAQCTVTVTATTPVTPSKPSTSGSSSSTAPTTEVKEDGTKVTTETKPDGTKVETVEEPDGTKVETVEEPDGTKAVTETKPDGTVTETVEEPDGTKAVTETKPDGSKTATVEQPDGTKSETVVTPEGDATITVTDPEGEEIAKVEIPATIPEPEDKFVDIDQTPWAEEAINKVAGLELVKGVGGNKYDPVTPMTRGALATVLHRLSNGKTDYEVAFKDVAANRYYTEGVAWAAKANVVKGISEDIFAPDQIITREQLAVMLARYAKLIGMSTKADAKSLDQFTDGDTTGAWAVDGMAWCVEKGILKGKGLNNLDPTADVSRAEVAVMLDRFIALIQK